MHAGLPEGPDEQFIHPSDAVGDQQKALVWTTYTAADPIDLWAGPSVIALDSGCGKGGLLTAVEFPAMLVYETRAQ